MTAPGEPRWRNDPDAPQAEGYPPGWTDERAAPAVPPPASPEPERPGGWVNGIGWVAIFDDLQANDLIAYFRCDADDLNACVTVDDATGDEPVIVTRWADGTRPAPPSPEARPDEAADDSDALYDELVAAARSGCCDERRKPCERHDAYADAVECTLSALGHPDRCATPAPTGERVDGEWLIGDRVQDGEWDVVGTITEIASTGYIVQWDPSWCEADTLVAPDDDDPAPAPVPPSGEGVDAIEAWLADEHGEVIRTIESALLSVSMDRGRGEKVSDQAEVVRVLRALRGLAARPASGSGEQ